jgi:hypothetical protein
MRMPSQGTSQAAFSAIAAIFSMFDFMNQNQATRQRVFSDRRIALAQFDDLYGRVCALLIPTYVQIYPFRYAI